MKKVEMLQAKIENIMNFVIPQKESHVSTMQEINQKQRFEAE